MSFPSAYLSHQPNWGLPEEDIDNIIKLEKMKDITKNFTKKIKALIKKFDFVAEIRIVSFNRDSGVDDTSNSFFNTMIDNDRNIIYMPDMSNKECCVIFVEEPNGINVLKNDESIIAHEYSHHIQFVYAGFPYYYNKGIQSTMGAPSFATPTEFGSSTGKAWVDNLLLPNYGIAIADSLERINDIICEGILQEKKIPSGLISLYKLNLTKPTPFIPNTLGKSGKRYIHRLMLRDYAEWGAIITLSDPKIVSSLLQKGRKKARNFNKKKVHAHQVYDSIFRLCLKTEFNLFREPKKVAEYSREIFNLLKIKLDPTI